MGGCKYGWVYIDVMCFDSVYEIPVSISYSLFMYGINYLSIYL